MLIISPHKRVIGLIAEPCVVLLYNRRNVHNVCFYADMQLVSEYPLPVSSNDGY